jgi:hypothetical protein
MFMLDFGVDDAVKEPEHYWLNVISSFIISCSLIALLSTFNGRPTFRFIATYFCMATSSFLLAEVIFLIGSLGGAMDTLFYSSIFYWRIPFFIMIILAAWFAFFQN